jgi:hypothetical protein
MDGNGGSMMEKLANIFRPRHTFEKRLRELVSGLEDGTISLSEDVKPAASIQDELKIGDRDDGGIYVGLSAENGKPLHTTYRDEREYLTFDEALAAAGQLKAVHPTAHVPTPEELDKNLFDNRNTGALKGTFNTSGSFPASVYRSSASYYYDGARVQYFDDGYQHYGDRGDRLPVRLVW